MVEQLYTNARTGTYKHPSRYVRAAVGIGRGARSGWVGAEQRALTSGAGVRAISSGNREGCAQRMGRIGVADGSERSNAPSLRGWEHLYSAKLIRMDGTERGLFSGKVTYGWGGRWKASRLLRGVRYESVYRG